MKKLLIMSVLAATIGATSIAQADDHGLGQDYRGDRQGQDNRGDNRGHDNRGNDNRGDNGQQNWGNRGGDNGRSVWRGGNGNPGWQGQRYRAPTQYYRPYGYQVRTWNGGDRLPRSYRARQYYVTDYRTYNLAPPPYGYRYVRVDNDVVLAAIATGVIATVIQGLYY
jgi:Ni/Co efflux regulator RcnB